MKYYILKSRHYNVSQAKNKKCRVEKINNRHGMIFRTLRITI